MVTRLIVPIGLVAFLVVTAGTLNLRNPFSKPQPQSTMQQYASNEQQDVSLQNSIPPLDNKVITAPDDIPEPDRSRASGSIVLTVSETTRSESAPLTIIDEEADDAIEIQNAVIEEEVKKMLVEEKKEAIQLEPKQQVEAKLVMATHVDSSKKTAISAPTTTSGAFRDESWLLSLKPESFTLQIGSLATEAAAKAYIMRFGFQSEATYYLSTKQEQNWYPVLYGVYANRTEAKKAIATLPKEVQLERPWARPLITIQESIASR